MRPIFHAQLVNGPFGDPTLLLDFKFERRALLFDLGDVSALSTRQLLRTTHVFVSHAHMDHFVGFDRLLRVCLGRDTGVTLYGPPGFIDKVGHKLAAYTWNLVESYEVDFVVTVHEVGLDWQVRTACFSSRRRFECEPVGHRRRGDQILLDEPHFKVRAEFLDHRTPCLAFAFEEGVHMNVWKNRLEELGLPTGPWLTELKRHLRAHAPAGMPISVRWRDRDGAHEKTFPVAELARRVLEFVPGQKVCYVTDVAWSADNSRRIAELARDADLLFIEAVFVHADRDHAARKAHLTARQAGEIARLARARSAVPFHFSPRYQGREAELLSEFERAWLAREAERG